MHYIEIFLYNAYFYISIEISIFRCLYSTWGLSMQCVAVYIVHALYRQRHTTQTDPTPCISRASLCIQYPTPALMCVTLHTLGQHAKQHIPVENIILSYTLYRQRHRTQTDPTPHRTSLSIWYPTLALMRVTLHTLWQHAKQHIAV